MDDPKQAKDKLNLITAVQTQASTYSDDKFFIDAVELTEQVLDTDIKAVLTDGAYSSYQNVQKLNENDEEKITWYHTGMQGAQGHYDFEKLNEDEYKVTDKRTGLKQITVKNKTDKFRIIEHHAKANYRYFKLKTIENYFRRKAKELYPPWVFGQRANGESTIHQVFCKLNGMKTKLRGLFKTHCYALVRCFWVNFKRIMAKTNKTSLECYYFFVFMSLRYTENTNPNINIINIPYKNNTNIQY